MNTDRTTWQTYWTKLDDAGHRYNTLEWLDFYARELMLYFPQQPVRALELGCGKGDLYNCLKQRFLTYVGLDFSAAMLSKFKINWPEVQLVCADGAHLPMGTGSYDLIFSYGVCQYLDQITLRNNLKQVHSLLNPTGVYLIGNIPDAQLRLLYFAGGLQSDRNISLLKLVRYLAAIWIKRKSDGIGYWYSRRFITNLAREHGFTCQTFSSAGYEYRFHAVLQKHAG